MIKSIEQNSADYLSECWKIKENVRREQSLLQQDWRFFKYTYTENEVYLYMIDEIVVGFGIYDTDKEYLSLLSIDPNYQSQGIGSKLMKEIIANHNTIYCHTRGSNSMAFNFYTGTFNFNIVEIVDNYYEDNESAYRLLYIGDA